MSEIKVICKNHGIVQIIQQEVTWIGDAPKPFSFCPYCGERTKVEYPKESNSASTWTYPTREEIEKVKQEEIDYYRKKYWDEK